MKKPFLFLPIVIVCFSPLLLHAQDPDIEANEKSALEEIFRSSDHSGEIPTSARERGGHFKKRVSVPRGAIRTGCVCMDGSTSDAHSTGACSGRGGVRFWVYRTKEGDTVQILTARHERHPQALDSAELSEINRPRPPARRSATTVQPQIQPIILSPVATRLLSDPAPVDHSWFDWSDAAAITGGGLSIFLTLRLLLRWIHNHQTLVRYALRHLLRFGKRPPPRKSRKSAGKTRV